MMQAQKETVGLAKPGGDMRPEHRVAKKPDAIPTLVEAGIDTIGPRQLVSVADRTAPFAPEPRQALSVLFGFSTGGADPYFCDWSQ
jgi:hypothetical protein